MVLEKINPMDIKEGDEGIVIIGTRDGVKRIAYGTIESLEGNGYHMSGLLSLSYSPNLSEVEKIVSEMVSTDDTPNELRMHGEISNTTECYRHTNN